MKNKWWIILLVILLLAAAVYMFWDAIVIRITPKVVLSSALAKTLSALDDRMEGSPVLVLTEALDANGRNTIDLDLDTSNELLGQIQYDMIVQIENSPRRILADGMVITGGQTLDLSVYLDSEFAAVSSQSLVQGNYYGVTYDTFSEDIRSNQLLAYLIGNDTISQWEESVDTLRAQMAKSYELPQLDDEDIQTALMGILSLKAQVSSESLALNDQNHICHRVAFAATGQEIANAAAPYWDQITPELRSLVEQMNSDPGSYVSAAFYVYEDVVVKLILELSAQDEAYSFDLLLGKNAALDDICIAATQRSGDDLKKLSAGISTTFDDIHYAEKLDILQITNGVQNRTVINYDWNRGNGDMQLNLTEGAENTALKLNLQETENGFQISTNQFEALMNALTHQEMEGNSACTMTVTKGASINTPEYKNFDQWSAEDFLILLSDIGGLLGLKIG